MYKQLLIFEEKPEKKLQREVDELHAKYDKLRKGQYARLNELSKMFKEAKEDIDIIKSALCKNQTRMF